MRERRAYDGMKNDLSGYLWFILLFLLERREEEVRGGKLEDTSTGGGLMALDDG
jgi:hypothetical protein